MIKCGNSGLSGLSGLVETGVLEYYQKVMSYGPLVYFPQWEGAGLVSQEIINGWNGAYTGVTLGQPGIGDGNTSPFFDGLNDLNNILTAGLIAGFNGAEGTIAVWVRVANAAVWTDGAFRYAILIQADAGNYVAVYRNGINNQLALNYRSGGGSNIKLINLNSLAWIHLAITWSWTASAIHYYLDGVENLPPDLVFNAWAGAITSAIIGAGSLVPVSVWHGWEAHGQIYTRALAPAEIADLYVI